MGVFWIIPEVRGWVVGPPSISESIQLVRKMTMSLGRRLWGMKDLDGKRCRGDFKSRETFILRVCGSEERKKYGKPVSNHGDQSALKVGIREGVGKWI